MENVKRDTSWGKAARWYDELIEGHGDTYQRTVILPNLLRRMDIRRGERVLDLACGQGFFARALAEAGARVTGVDISKELIALAKRRVPRGVEFMVASADNLGFLKNGSIDKAVFVLAIQNIENVHGAFAECARALRPNGGLYIVMNHPAFRVPKESSWGWDPSTKLGASAQSVQYRRIDRYISESKERIQMHPGDKPEEYTLTFHRPFQFYFKAFAKAGFAVTGLEEWISHKKSEPGPRQKAEDRARKEIPLFLFIEGIKSLAISH